MAPPAFTATQLSSHPEAGSSRYLNPAQPPSPTRGIIELGRIPEPIYLGGSGQWDMMRPQKGSISGDLSSGSSLYQLNSKPTGNTQTRDVLSSEGKYRQDTTSPSLKYVLCTKPHHTKWRGVAQGANSIMELSSHSRKLNFQETA